MSELDLMFEEYLDSLDVDVSSFLGMDEDNFSFAGDVNSEPTNLELFQHLQFTSTPNTKAQSKRDDGNIDEGNSNGKRIDKGEMVEDIVKKGKKDVIVLQDISHVNSPASSSSSLPSMIDSFVEITKGKLCSPEQGHQSKVENDSGYYEKFVPIIRKKISIKKDETSAKSQLVYYSGLGSFEKALAVVKVVDLDGGVKRLKRPTSVTNSLSSYKRIVLTLMKLRLDLEFIDLSFRFDLPNSVLVETYERTLKVLEHSLRHLILWSGDAIRIEPELTYVLKKTNEVSQVLLIVKDSPESPVVYVTSSHPKTMKPTEILMKELGTSKLVENDVFCINDTRQIFRFRDSGFFMENCLMVETDLPVIRALDKYHITRMSCDPIALTVVSSLVNFDSLPLGVDSLERIYRSSSRIR